MATPEQKYPASAPRAAARPHRLLACVHCQQRKVRCDREFPCASCVRIGVQCVPTAAPRQRRRRFPERDLLDRLRHHEALLAQHNIPFEPLHGTVETASPFDDSRSPDPGNDRHSKAPVTDAIRSSRQKAPVKSKPEYAAKSFWNVMKEMSLEPEDCDDSGNYDHDNDSPQHDEAPESVVKRALDQVYESRDPGFLFGARKASIDITSLHPSQAQIFKLWQIYLENVDPLLKVTHTPTLQARIIDAACKIESLSPTLEALMFSIYCVALLSLDDHECSVLMGSSKSELLKQYKLGCQQALVNCGVFCSGDRECLTAYFLYLISVRPDTNPRSLSSLLSIAMRNAQRIGIHLESNNVQFPALEGEMRRRLWWSLVMFDHRICEMSDHKTSMLTPTWDCKIPLNVNDCDLRPEMKNPPTAHERPSEAIFAVMRSELGEFVRHSAFHLDFTNPALKPIAKDLGSDPFTSVERDMEDKYLRFCNQENPLHFTALWTARGLLSKNRLLEKYSKFSSTPQTDAQRNTVISYALTILDWDTKLMTSPLTKGYRWLIHFNFPFPAYLYIIIDLRKRPMEKHADKAWEIISNNHEFRLKDMDSPNALSDYMRRLVLGAWEAREVACRQQGLPMDPPRIIVQMRQKMAQTTSSQPASQTQTGNSGQQVGGALGINFGDISMSLPMQFGGGDPFMGMEGQNPMGSGPGGFPDMFGQSMMGDADQPGWPTMNFGMGW
ncbi:hypothetical protein BO71DRAFT_174478 [Aspergillus ellipticus CBS 707.79]|uniref:Zn(2)-C6 fungal-type domain-containing protein n=1 Tax=Aspergillus ellipticus CBS 707.79 TaxID=1448320 RepID=A0A319DGQ5_9EURO|nr:hypothetical protein BO71DRAFT_174478 [Aspergillus ellipticus CBS 707.79]